MAKLFGLFVKNQSGATAIEYSLIALAMGLMLVAGMPLLTNSISADYTSVSTHLSTGQ